MESGNKIQKSDIKKVFWRFQLYGGSWNFERMQNVGFLYSIKPVLKRIGVPLSKHTTKLYAVDAMNCIHCRAR